MNLGYIYIFKRDIHVFDDIVVLSFKEGRKCFIYGYMASDIW